jgi:hypothetical protein
MGSTSDFNDCPLKLDDSDPDHLGPNPQKAIAVPSSASSSSPPKPGPSSLQQVKPNESSNTGRYAGIAGSNKRKRKRDSTGRFCSGRKFVGCRRSTYLGVVSEWLRSCHEDHNDCPKGDMPLPSRVLDVGAIGLDRLHLRISNGEYSSYAALSHCWGGGILARTTRENLKARQNCIFFAELPKTFQDAVTVTRDLGLRFLWIDALCIVQDDKSDWEQESGNMAAVYQNAYVVIGADMSGDSNGGFLDQVSHDRSCDPGAFVDNQRATIHARARHKNPCPLLNNEWPSPRLPPGVEPGPLQPLARRAWTLQEQILATRMIHFTNDEMVWDCRSGLRCECMELDHGYSDGENQRIAYNNCLASSAADKFTAWSRVVDSIMVRNLTYKKDILPALSGLAKQMQDSGAGTHDLPEGLLWTTELSIPRRVRPYRAPSWSWASVETNHGPYFRRTTYGETKLGKVYAKILEAHCTPSGKDPLGTVSNGHINLSAPLLEVGWEDTSYGNFHLVHLDTKIKHRIFAHFDFGLSLHKGETFHCLFIGVVYLRRKIESEWSVSECCGLILRRSRASEGMFERVGFFRLEPEKAEDFLKDSKESIITII